MRVVIAGGVAGGATAAARIRRLDEQAEIVVYERSGYICAPYGQVNKHLLHTRNNRNEEKRIRLKNLRDGVTLGRRPHLYHFVLRDEVSCG